MVSAAVEGTRRAVSAPDALNSLDRARRHWRGKVSRRSPNQRAGGDGGSSPRLHIGCQERGASDVQRYRDMKLHSLLFGWSNPDQALRVAAGILGKRASGGTTRALRVRCQGCEAFPTMHRTWKPQSGVELESEDRVKTK